MMSLQKRAKRFLGLNSLKPLAFLLLYLSTIFVFAVIYTKINAVQPSAANCSKVDCTLTFQNALYFSTITITTVGFGDFAPVTYTAKLLVGVEAIFGIVIIGLFLSASWQQVTDAIQKSQDELIKSRLAHENRAKLLTYYSYLSSVIMDFLSTVYEVTTPISSRSSGTAPTSFLPNKDFMFSGLQDLFKPSLRFKDGFTNAVINNYFDKLDFLLAEFKLLVINFDLTDYPELHACIINFLVKSKNFDSRGSLYTLANDPRAKKQIEDCIKQSSEPPSIEEHPSHLLTPVILLYMMLNIQLELLATIEEKLVELGSMHNTFAMNQCSEVS